MDINALPAKELKRRGAAALEESLKKGPVHIIKNNRLAFVVLSAVDYSQLRKQAPGAAGASASVWDLANEAAQGKTSRKALEQRLKRERDAWDKR
jgi:PHD/YefM family antitoxin component YafN of YafNO toxin-antitoxin module